MSKFVSRWMIALAASCLTTACAQTHRAPDVAAQLESRLAPLPGARSSVLTLDAACERALATDQSIRIAWLEVTKSDLLSWRALTRLEPRIRGSFGVRETDLDRRTVSSARTDTLTNGSSSSLRNGFTSQGLPQTTAETAAFTHRQRQTDKAPTETLARTAHGASASVILEQPLLDLTVFPAWKLGKLSAQAARLQ